MSSNYKDDVFLYGSTGKAITLTDLPPYVESRLAANKTVVLYVHGRGAEPNKSLHEEKIVGTIEQQHGVECIMFSWDSEAGGALLSKLLDRERPLSKVPRGIHKLAEAPLSQPSKNCPARLFYSFTVWVASLCSTFFPKGYGQRHRRRSLTRR